MSKTAKVVKQASSNSTTAIDTSAQATCDSLFPYSPEPGDVIIELSLNPNKIKATQPGLLGSCKLGNLEVSLVFWGSETQDGSKYYYSCTMQDAVKSKEAWKRDRSTIEPLHKLKFYEFRKGRPTDPDFTIPESFIEGGHAWWGSMWVFLPENADALDQIRYFVVFSSKPFRQALSAQAKENTSDMVARLLERRREMEMGAYYKAKQALDAEQLDEDELP